MPEGSYELGQINGSLIGVAMRAMVDRAIRIIKERIFAETDGKVTNQATDNITTSVDLEVQATYFDAITKSFPSFGIVAEEGMVNKPCTLTGHDVWFTVDAIDGTRAFLRRASHGVGTMISLVYDGEVIGAYVGDVTSEEKYGYHPESDIVRRFSFHGYARVLSAEPQTTPVNQQAILLRDSVDLYCDFFHDMLTLGKFPREQEIVRGSIGLSFAELWKREVGAIVLRSGIQRPWDCVPFVGISRKLGFVFFELHNTGRYLSPFDFPVCKEPFQIPLEILVVHGSQIEEFRELIEP
jgi:fructose-1,6-bisphosphatase/inositol monophosphatase family enzyme